MHTNTILTIYKVKIKKSAAGYVKKLDSLLELDLQHQDKTSNSHQSA
jgi:hypothetical protein